MSIRTENKKMDKKAKKTSELKYFLIGEGPVTKAVGQVLELFEVAVINDASKDSDFFVMADGEEYPNPNNLIISSGNVSIIYLESEDKEGWDQKHNLYFLTHMLPTYRIPLKRFSLIELVRITERITNKELKSIHSEPQAVFNETMKALRT